MTNPFIPIIVGTDINAYNMAISFHEAYGIHPILVGKEPLSFTSLSTIPGAIELFPKLGEKKEFAAILKKSQPNTKLRRKNYSLSVRMTYMSASSSRTAMPSPKTLYSTISTKH